MPNPRLAADATSRTPLFHGSLGRAYLWVCLVAPVVTLPVFSRNFFELCPAVMAVSLAGNALPSWTVPVAVVGAYRFVLPHLLRRVRSTLGQVLAHAVVSALAASVAALIIRPAMVLFSAEQPPALGFAAGCVVMTWAFVLPGLVIERQQDLAAEKDRRLQVERESALRAELEALRARTQPHFLFNALNTVASLIVDNPSLAEETVERLASVLRYVLSSSTVDSVPLRREVEVLVDYLEVQRARFGERLRYAIEVEAGLDDLCVPPMMLQPLVENAVLHGISGRANGGVVRVSVRLRSPILEIIVCDDGQGAGSSRHDGTGTSLRDLKRRLELLHGRAAWLVTRVDDGGFAVEIGMPVGRLGVGEGAVT